MLSLCKVSKAARLASLGLLFLFSSPGNAQVAPPLPDHEVQGNLQATDVGLEATVPSVVRLTVPANQDIISLGAKAGSARGGVQLTLKDAKGVTATFGITAEDQRIYSGANSDKPLPDSLLRLTWPGKFPLSRGGFFVRPNMDMYSDARRREVFKTWSDLPAASAHFWNMEFRRTGQGAQLWFNGHFMKEVEWTYPLASAEIKLAVGAVIKSFSAAKAQAADLDRFVPLPVNAYPRGAVIPGAMVKLDAGHVLPPGMLAPGAAAPPSIAVNGLGRIPARSDDLVSLTWRRGPVDSISETRIFAVPAENYSFAHILCATDGDPAGTPRFTLRLTRYGRSRGDAMADSNVEVPVGDGKISGATRVGQLSFTSQEGPRNVPLWLVRVPLKTGLIQDLMRDDKTHNAAMGTARYLDCEILDPIFGTEEDDLFPPLMEPKRRYHLPSQPRSNVRIFAAMLEQSPAEFDVRPNTPLRAMYASDSPEWQAKVVAREPGTYNVAWDFADVNGKIVETGKKSVTLSAVGAQETVKVPIKTENGWFATRFRLEDVRGENLVDVRSAFVFLPPDKRKAGFESPYGTWWFHWAHGGEPNIDAVGPLLQRAGLRHTTLPETLPEAKTKAYGVTAWAVPWRVSLKPTMEEMMALHEAHIRKYLELWPSLRTMKVWHESGANGAPFPSELWDVPAPPMNDVGIKNWEFRLSYVNALAKMVREKFPDMKIQYGNDGNSLGIIGGLLRAKFPREYIDTIATEDLGQTIIPERAIIDSLQSVWFLRQTARKMGYRDIPVTASYEWMNRRSHAVGLRSQAEWQIRDALHAKAYGFTTIALGTVHDAGTGYYYSLWGGGGLTRRYPVMEPKPIYAAIATHTQLMDGARFVRAVPTNSLTLYALEFQKGNEWVYAFWTPRGTRAAQLEFAGAGTKTNVDLYGKERPVTGATPSILVTTGPQYVVSPVQLQNVVPGAATFPLDLVPQGSFVINPLEKVTDVSLVEGPASMEQKRSIPHGTQGMFEVREVMDEEKGACLELELKPQAGLWEAMHEFVQVQINAPKLGPGPYTNAGLWVKGNGGWGDIRFMVKTEKGSFVAQNLHSSWSGRTNTNFEGWNYLSHPVTYNKNWETTGTVTALIITLPQKALYLTEMQKVPSLKIRIKGLALH